MPNKKYSFEILLCPDKMSDGTPGTVQLVCNVGLATLAAAKRELRAMAKHPNQPTGFFWVQDYRGVPLYGLFVQEEPKTERVPVPPRDLPNGRHLGGYATRTVPGQTQRRIKPGNMPWNRRT